MSTPPRDEALREALDAIIQGRFVTRSRHELVHDGDDVTALFQRRLAAFGFSPTTVANVPCEPGERVPGFLVENRVAWFGWVFWELFTRERKRKLWGSVVRNGKGDWQIQLGSASSRPVYVNPAMKLPMDVERPSG